MGRTLRNRDGGDSRASQTPSRRVTKTSNHDDSEAVCMVTTRARNTRKKTTNDQLSKQLNNSRRSQKAKQIENYLEGETKHEMLKPSRRALVKVKKLHNEVKTENEAKSERSENETKRNMENHSNSKGGSKVQTRTKLVKSATKTSAKKRDEIKGETKTKRKASKRVLEVKSEDSGKAESVTSCIPVKKQKSQKSKSDTDLKLTKSMKNKSVHKFPTKRILNTSIDLSDIKGLLMKFEGNDRQKEEGKDDGGESDDSSDDEWEEVDMACHSAHAQQQQVRTEPVEITLQATSIMKKKRKKGGFDWEDWYRLQRNRKRKDSQAHAHQVHLLCLLAHGFHSSTLCNNTLIHAAMLSLVPQTYLNLNTKQWGLVKLTQISTWFSKTFALFSDGILQPCSPVDRMIYSIQSRVVQTKDELVSLYIALLRMLGLHVRLVLSFQPMTYKAKNLEAKVKETDEENDIESAKVKTATTRKCSATSTNKRTTSKPHISKSLKPKVSKENTESKYFSSGSKNTEDNTKISKMSKSDSKSKASAGKRETKSQKDSVRLTLSQKVKNKSRRKSANKVNYCDESEGESHAANMDVKNKKKRPNKNDEVECMDTQSDSGSEFEELQTSFRSPSNTRVKKNNRAKRTSTDSDMSNPSAQKGHINVWAEVYLESDSAWISVDCVRNQVKCRDSMENVATRPLQYVIAFQPENYVAKDLTQKYSSEWLLTKRKLRHDDVWWESTMSAYRDTLHIARDRAEDLFMKGQLMKTPLPKSLSDYKGHPLFVLSRHLLKFEGIYPPDAVPVGYFRGDPVYARECVHTLHSRETWLKEARMVRVKEEAYKWVKARPKKNQINYNPEEKNLAIFGLWQTEDYMPPIAVNGKVPRNAYGNVDMYKPCMLPTGTVHLTLPGLNKVARKLDIDCASAMVGFDLHNGYTHPIMDGFIVCTEFSDTLIAAWDEEQEIQREKELQQRERRVIENWSRLTKGLLIRQRLKHRYDLIDPHGQEREEKKAKKTATKSTGSPQATGSTTAANINTAWPLNRQNEKQKKTNKNKKKQEQGPLFPFEVETM